MALMWPQSRAGIELPPRSCPGCHQPGRSLSPRSPHGRNSDLHVPGSVASQ